MQTRQEIVDKFTKAEQNKRLSGVKNKAVVELKNLSPVDRALVSDLVTLKNAHGINKIMKLLSIINLSEQ